MVRANLVKIAGMLKRDPPVPPNPPIDVNRFLFLTLALAMTALPAAAEPGFSCRGLAPDWQLQLTSTQAQLSYDRRDTTFEVPHFTPAEGRDWPRAYSLIADFDTAIVIVAKTACTLGDGPISHRAEILTQRGQTPVLLTGCCEILQ